MPGTRRQEYADATRAAVLTAARARFITDGYAATSVDAIAVDARVGKGSVFHHFANKQAVFEAVFEAEEHRLLADIGERLSVTDDPRGTLETGSRLFLEACAQPEVRELLLVQAPQALGWARWKALEAQHFLGVVRHLVAQLVPPDSADLTTYLVIALLDEAALRAASSDNPPAAVNAALAAMLSVIDGAGPP